MNFHFSGKQLSNFKENAKREWALTNGIGGYAGGCVLGSLGRTHQGYLIASIHPPVERYLVLSKTNEVFCCETDIFNLECAQHAGKELDPIDDYIPRESIYTEGQKYLTAFDYDGTVCFTYQAGNITLEKNISLLQGENTVAVGYHVTNTGADAELFITPLMNYREHSSSSTKETLLFQKSILSEGTGFTLIPESNKNIKITLCISEGELIESERLYDENLQFATEVENEAAGLDTCYTPYQIKIQIPAHSTKDISLLCHAGEDWNIDITSKTAFEVLEASRKLLTDLVKTAECKDEFSQVLTIAANQFLSYRASTGLTTVLAGLPWFTDWGRDTMIAFTGLVLSTKRFDKAEEILLTFAKYINDGMVPNMFPDNGQDPLYNTADASLWYFYAVHKYLEYNNTPKAYAFIEKNIYPALKEIISAYKTGTLFSIHMDEDGLIHAGSGLDQVTWMDVRVNNWVPTPRHGKPVEINALWYNALMVMNHLSKAYGEKDFSYSQLAEKVKKSFCHKFWDEKNNCLYDVISEEIKDDSIRPNQIYAVSLPYTMLDELQAKSVVDVVKEKLYVGVGLRSLDPDHKDYHPIYVGSLAKRDAAYHQGTAWGFLLGGFITAYTKVYGASKETASKTLQMLEPMKAHLYDNCVGSLSEIFDGNPPHHGRGCYAQAWSVGEILRCYTEDIYPYL